jgi:hypothetical protein
MLLFKLKRVCEAGGLPWVQLEGPRLCRPTRGVAAETTASVESDGEGHGLILYPAG